jgi:hypothetical protein
MLGNAHFYNRTIRKVVVAFGTLFNDIYLHRQNLEGSQTKERFKIPLNYGSKEKYLTRISSDPTLTKSIDSVVPRISFDLDGLTYDASRKMPSMIRNFSPSTQPSVSVQFVPVPYDFNFSLSIYTRNTEDATQILEQILPFFTPDFTVTIDFIPGMEQKYDLPIILNSVESQVDYEGDLMTTRLIIWNLQFTAKGNIWPPMKNAEIILEANTNIYIDTSDSNTQKVYVDKANGSGTYVANEVIRVTDRDLTGKVLYWSNSNSGILIVNSLNKPLKSGDVVVGDNGNATYTISSLYINNLPAVTIITSPDPSNALPNSSFGFSTEITENN